MPAIIYDMTLAAAAATASSDDSKTNYTLTRPSKNAAFADDVLFPDDLSVHLSTSVLHTHTHTVISSLVSPTSISEHRYKLQVPLAAVLLKHTVDHTEEHCLERQLLKNKRAMRHLLLELTHYTAAKSIL